MVQWSQPLREQGSLNGGMPGQSLQTESAVRGAGVAQVGWPRSGLTVAVQAQAAQLLQALSASAPGIPPPLLPLSVQAWSPAFLVQWLGQGQSPRTAQPPLALWAGQPLQVKVPSGLHSLFVQLFLPGDAGMRPAPKGAGTATGVLRWPESPLLGAGALAWVLAPEDQPLVSALMVLEWGPRREALVYGKEPGLVRHDPWLLQAQWLASGVKERLPLQSPPGPLCDRTGCPYQGEAMCPQPFCPATGSVPAVDAA